MTARKLLGHLLLGFAAGLAACGGDDLVLPPTTGSLAVTTNTAGGADVDPDGYLLLVDAQEPQPIGTAATVQIDELTPGTHSVGLSGLAANCSVNGDNPRSVTIAVGEVTNATFELACGGTTGALQVTVETTGDSPDADGYAISLDGSDRGPIGANATVQLGNLPPGSHVVGLTGVSANCSIQGDDLKVVSVAAGETAAVSFSVGCVQPAPNVGTLRIRTSTSGEDFDGDGYRFSVDGGDPQAIGVNASTDVSNTEAGTHNVTLSDLASNCTADDPSKSVEVPSGGIGTVSFTIICTSTGPETGSIRVTTQTTGDNPDADGYQFTVDDGAPQSIESNGERTVTAETGRHNVELSGVASNCSVNDASQSTNVRRGETETVAFRITCSATTGAIRVTTSTGGSEPDQDGYQFTIDGGSPQAIGTNDQQTVGGLTPGNHTVQLSGVAANCTVDLNPQTVTVTPGGTATAPFTITCAPTTGSIRVAATTIGESPDPDGYIFTIERRDDNQVVHTEGIDPNGEETVADLPAGEYRVRLSEVASNCSVDDDSKDADVVPGSITPVSFVITCSAPVTSGSIRVTTTTTGDAPDPDGYALLIDQGSPLPIGTAGEVTVTDVAAGGHAVELSGYATNCNVAPGPSQDTVVSAGQTSDVAFTVDCPSPPPSSLITRLPAPAHS